MNERQRSMYYFEGSAVRKLDVEVETPKTRPEKRPSEKERVRPREERRLSERELNKMDKALAFDLKYTIFVAASVMVMVGACIMMLFWESKLETQKSNIAALEKSLDAAQTDNMAYKMSIDSMYTLDELYDAAVNDLGMVYARKGQIVYYDSADEDYVKQYQDVPAAN